MVRPGGEWMILACSMFVALCRGFMGGFYLLIFFLWILFSYNSLIWFNWVCMDVMVWLLENHQTIVVPRTQYPLHLPCSLPGNQPSVSMFYCTWYIFNCFLRTMHMFYCFSIPLIGKIQEANMFLCAFIAMATAFPHECLRYANLVRTLWNFILCPKWVAKKPKCYPKSSANGSQVYMCQ